MVEMKQWEPFPNPNLLEWQAGDPLNQLQRLMLWYSRSMRLGAGPNNCDGEWDKGEAVKGDEVKAKNECWHQSDAEASHSN